jgi:dipeptidyl aminopeptidase/acylaminoacyl peptidase
MHTYSKVLALLVAMFFLPACLIFSRPVSPTPKPTSPAKGVESSSTPGPNPAAIMPTDTPFPQIVIDTRTPLPPTPLTPSDTPAPTSLNASGPYVLFKAPTGLWISNPDGSFLTQLLQSAAATDLRQALSPKGDQLALVVQNDQGLDLMLVKIPGGETEKIAHLIDYTAQDSGDAVSPKSFAVYAMRDYDSLAWQPGEGRLLAFMGAIKGPTSDLYLYDTQTQKITQMTNGPSQAVMPSWSPDGQYILHFGVSWVPPFGGAIIGANRLDGVWSVNASTGEVITLPRPLGNHPNFAGWLDATHFITYDSSDQCFSQNLRGVDVVSGKAAAIMQYSFYYQVAQSPENGALLFPSAAGCTNSLGDGIYLLPAGQTTPDQLTGKKAYEVSWMPESKVFNAYPEALFSADGQTRYDPPVYDASYHPAISKQGYQAWQVIQNQKGRVVVKADAGDWQTISTGFVDQLLWDPAQGKTLLIVMDDGTLYSAADPDFTPQKMGKMDRAVGQAIWTP